MYRCNDLTVVGGLRFLRNLSTFSDRGAIPSELIDFPKNSTFACPNLHLGMLNFNPALSVACSTSIVLSIMSSPVWAPIPTSSTYRAHLFAFTRGSRHSRITLVKAERTI